MLIPYGPGTNTYLIMPPCDWNFDDRNTLLPAVLVDTGDAKEEYAPILECVLRGHLCVSDEALPVRIAITDMYVVTVFQFTFLAF